MSFISDEDLQKSSGMNLAPMIDFLFLMLVFFASLAISRIATRDTTIDLVEIKPEASAQYSTMRGVETAIISIHVSSDNKYKWMTDIRDYEMESAEAIKEELISQYERGLLPEDLSRTQIKLKIDKKAEWEPILKVIFAIRDAGFDVKPVYMPEELSEYSLAEQGQTNLENQKEFL